MPRDAGRGTGLIPKGSILGRDVQLANSKNLVNTWPQTKVFEAALDVLDRINDGRITKEDLSRELKDEKHLESNKEKLDEITAQLKARGAQVNGSDDLVEYFQILLNVGVDEKHKDFAQFNADKSKRSAAEKARDLYERGAPLTRLLKSLLMVVGEDIIKPIDSGYRPRLDIPPSTPSSWSQYRSFSPSDHTPTPLPHSDTQLTQQVIDLQEQVDNDQEIKQRLQSELEAERQSGEQHRIELNKSKTLNDQLQRQLEVALESIKRLEQLSLQQNQHIESAEAQRDIDKQQISTLEKQLAGRSELSAEEAQSLQDNLKRQQEQLASDRDAADQQAATIAALEKQLAGRSELSAEEVPSLQDNLKRQQEQLASDRDAADQQAATIAALEKQLAGRSELSAEEVQSLQDNLKRQQEQLASDRDAADQQAATIVALEKRLAGRSELSAEDVKALQDRLAFSEGELDAVLELSAGELDAAQERIKRLESQVSEKNAEMARIEEDYRDAELTRKKQLESVEAQRDLNQQELMALKEQLAGRSELSAEEVQSLQDNLKRQQEQLASDRDAVDQQAATIVALEKQLAGRSELSAEEVQSLQDNLKRQQEQLASDRDAADQQAATIAALEKQLAGRSELSAEEVQSLQDNLKRQQEQLASDRDAADQQAATIAALEKQLAGRSELSAEEVQSLQDNLKRQQEQLASDRDAADQQAATIAALEKQLAGRSELSAEEAQSLQDNLKRQQEQLASDRDAADQQAATIAALEKQLAGRSELSAEEAQSLQDNLKRQQEQLASDRDAADQQAATIAALEKQLAGRSELSAEEVQSLQDNLKRQQEQLASDRDAVDQQAATIAALEKQLAGRSELSAEEVQSLQDNLKRQQEQLASDRDAADQQAATIAALEKQLAGRSELSAEDVKALQDRLAFSEGELDAVLELSAGELDAAQERIKRLESQVSEKNAEMARIEEDYRDAELTRKKQLESVEAQRDLNQQELMALKEQLAGRSELSAEEVQSLQDNLKRQQEQLASDRDAVDQQAATIVALEKQLAGRSELSAEEVQSLQDNLKRQQEQLASDRDAADQQAATIAALEKQLAGRSELSAEEVQSLQDNLKRQQEQLASDRDAADQQAATIAALEKQLAGRSELSAEEAQSLQDNLKRQQEQLASDRDAADQQAATIAALEKQLAGRSELSAEEVQSLQDNLKRQQEQLASDRDAADQQAATIVALEKQLAGRSELSAEEVQSLQDNLKRQQEQLASDRDAADQQAATIAALEKQLAGRSELSAEEVQSLQDNLKRQQEQLASDRDAADQQAATIAALEKQLAGRSELSAEEAQSLQDNLKRQQEQLASDRDAADQQAATIAALEKQLAGRSELSAEEVQSLQDNLKRQQEQLASDRDAADQQAATIAALEKQLAGRSELSAEEVQSLQDNLKRQQEQLASDRDAADQQAATIAALEKQLAGRSELSAEEVQSLQDNLKRQQEQLASDRDAADQQAATIAALEKQLAGRSELSAEEAQSLQDNLKRQQEQLASDRDAVDQQAATIAALEKQLAGRSELSAEEVQSLQDNLKRQQEQLASDRDAADQQAATIAALEKQLAGRSELSAEEAQSLQDNLKRQQEQLASDRDAADQQAATIAALEKQLAGRSELSAEEVQSLQDKLAGRSELSAEDVKGLQDQLQATRKELQTIAEAKLVDLDPDKLADMVNLSGVDSPKANDRNVNANKRALAQVTEKINYRCSEFDKLRDEIEKENTIPDINNEVEPSKIVTGERVKEQIELLKADIDTEVGKYTRRYGDKTAGENKLRAQVQKINKSLDDHLLQIDKYKKMIEGDAVQKWLTDVPKFDETCDTPEQYLSDVLPYIVSVFESNTNNQDVASYVSARTIRIASELFVNRCKEELEDKSLNKLQLQERFINYSQCLRQLHPDRIHSGIHNGKLSKRAIQFASAALAQSMKNLDEVFNSRRQTNSDLLKGIEKTARDQAVDMLEHPEIRPMLLALINSAKKKHEGVEISAVSKNLDLVLKTGLLDIRDRFNLHPMPDMRTLLRVCLDDLEKHNSRLVRESAHQHQGTLQGRNEIARSAKLTTLCNDILKRLGRPDVSAQKTTPNISRLMTAFQNPEGIFDLTALGESTRRVDGSFERMTVVGDSPLNAFFHGVPDASWRRADAGAESIAIDGGQPAGVVFEKNSANEWHGVLGNKHYTVHPRLLYQFPDIAIPFENRWLPVKADDGQVGVLVLQKTANESQYFLYEPAGNGQLKPKSINSASAEEMIDATFLLQAATERPVSTSQQNRSRDVSVEATQKALKLSAGIEWVGTKWGVGNKELAALYDKARQDISNQNELARLITTEDRSDFLEANKVEESQYHKIQANKRDRKAIGTSLGNASLESDQPLYEKLSVDACFDRVGEKYYELFPALPKSQALVESGRNNLKKFKQGAFQQLSIFEGCEIKPSAKEGAPGSIQQVVLNVEKVLKVNRDRQLRLNQGVDYLTADLGTRLRKNKAADFNTFRDDELVDFAVSEFKKGKLPVGGDHKRFCDDLVQLMLIKNERDFSVGMGHRLDALKSKMMGIKSDNYEFLTMSEDQYIAACQELNLDTALLAVEQKEANQRIAHYYSNGLNERNRVMLAFEQGGLMLRGNQPEMAGKVFDVVENMGENRQNLIFQLGTGYGKSKTVIPLAVDQAYRKGYPARIIAPESNQAELDHLLFHYFADQGVKYRRLDLFKDYVDPALASDDKMWWSVKNLGEILNMVEQNEPLGVSTKDVQLLMVLKDKLKASMTSSDEVAVLEKILDLLQYSGLNIFDEYDRTVMPGRPEEFDWPTREMNRALTPMGADGKVGSHELAVLQAAFLTGSNNKICLSATVGSAFTMASLTKSETLEEAEGKYTSDPMTTNARFFNWLTKTTPIACNGTSADSDRVDIIKTAMAQSGKDKQVILFDGNDKAKTEEDRFESVQKTYWNLYNARGPEAQGKHRLLYYNDRKELCMFDPLQEQYQQCGARISPEMELLIRKDPQFYDVLLFSEDGVGTDCPQKRVKAGKGSIGIHLGFCEDPNRNLKLFSQEFGRFSRSSDNFWTQDWFVATDTSKLVTDRLPHSEGRKQEQLVEAYSKALVAVRDARSSLIKKLGQSEDGLQPQQRRVINKLLHVSSPNREQPYDANLENDLQSFIDSGECEGFASVRDELKAFKKAQWVGQNAFLDMVAGVMALREKSPFGIQCEEYLEKGVLRSETDEILSKAHTWCGDGAKSVLEVVELDSVLSPEKATKRTTQPSRPRSGVIKPVVVPEPDYHHDVFVKTLTRELRDAVHKELQTIERESSDRFSETTGLKEVAQSDHVYKHIEACIDRLKKEGVKSGFRKEVNSIPSELMAHCQKMKKKADKVFDNLSAACNNGEDLVGTNTPDSNGVSKLLVSNPGVWIQLVKVKENFNKDFEAIEKGNLDKLADFCKAPGGIIENFYHDLARKITNLQFKKDERNANNFYHLTKILGKGMPKLLNLDVSGRKALYGPNDAEFPTQFKLVTFDHRRGYDDRGKPSGWDWSAVSPEPTGDAKSQLNMLDDLRKAEKAKQKARDVVSDAENLQLQDCLNQIRKVLLDSNVEFRERLVHGAVNAQEKIDRRKDLKWEEQ
ncbi:hypothetical protein [Endozoicomonas sp.]|uniref:hypothetical protein n=1 Tax=Endozoicomonas sp. TaxID=1892382 RepID=UPI003AF9D9CB